MFLTLACPAGRRREIENSNGSGLTKKTRKAFAIILCIDMVLAMLYACVLFPNFGA